MLNLLHYFYIKLIRVIIVGIIIIIIIIIPVEFFFSVADLPLILGPSPPCLSRMSSHFCSFSPVSALWVSKPLPTLGLQKWAEKKAVWSRWLGDAVPCLLAGETHTMRRFRLKQGFLSAPCKWRVGFLLQDITGKTFSWAHKSKCRC